MCLRLTFVVVFCGVVFVKHSNTCWLSIFVLLLWLVIKVILLRNICVLSFQLLLSLSQYLQFYPLLIVNIFSFFLLFLYVNIIFNLFIMDKIIIILLRFTIVHLFNSYYTNSILVLFLVYYINYLYLVLFAAVLAVVKVIAYPLLCTSTITHCI